MPFQNKKVLITLPCLSSDPGGVASYYNATLPHMNDLEGIRLELYELGSTHGQNTRFHRIIDQVDYIKTLSRIKPDLVHVNPSLNLKSFIRDGMIIFWSKQKKIPTLIFFRGWEKPFEKKLGRGLLRWYFNLTYKRSELFIVLASEFKTALRAWGITQPVLRFTTAVNESLLRDFSISQKVRQVIEAPQIRILFLSRLEKQKGVFRTIEAFELLLEHHENIHLTIAGDGSIRTQVQEFISQRGLSEKISLPGYVTGEKKARLFSSHDIYCFPTRYGEGMPNSVLEAMAFGMVIVTTPAGGIKDFFKDKTMGALCLPPSPGVIAEKIKPYIDSKQKIADVAYFNYNYAKAHFMGSIAARSLTSLYRKLLF